MLALVCELVCEKCPGSVKNGHGLLIGISNAVKVNFRCASVLMAKNSLDRSDGDVVVRLVASRGNCRAMETVEKTLTGFPIRSHTDWKTARRRSPFPKVSTASTTMPYNTF